METLNIYQEMQWFLGIISRKNYIKLETAKKSKVTNERFKRHVYGQPKVSLTKNTLLAIPCITDNN